MRLRSVVMAVLALALLGNMLFVLDALTLGLLTPKAQAESKPAEETAALEKPAVEQPAVEQPAAEKPAPAPAITTPTEGERAYQTLVNQLTAQKIVLEKKAADLAERERQLSVLRQELTAQAAKGTAPGAPPAGAAPAGAGGAKPGKPETPAFTKLVKAYEGMEPANASSALAELVAKDRQVVVDILLGMKARQAAAILDSLAATNPTIAADLSYEVWRRDPDHASSEDGEDPSNE